MTLCIGMCMGVQNTVSCELVVSIEGGLDIFGCKLEFDKWLPDSIECGDWVGCVDSFDEENMQLVLQCGYVSTNMTVSDIVSQIGSEFTFVTEISQV